MFQTGYKEITSFSKGLSFIGGICQFWFTPKQNILIFPKIDPLTQYLDGDIVLKDDSFWHGPVAVPDGRRGFSETQEKNKAGLFYKTKVYGIHPGHGRPNHINLENLAWHQFVIVAKVRSSGAFLVFGNNEVGLDFDHEFKTEDGGNKGTANTTFTFTGESIAKALILPSFDGETSGDLDGSPAIPYITKHQTIDATSYTAVADGETVITPLTSIGGSMIGYDIIQVEKEIKPMLKTDYNWNKTTGQLTLLNGISIGTGETLYIIHSILI